MHIEPDFDFSSDDLDSSSDGKVDHGETHSIQGPFICLDMEEFRTFLSLLNLRSGLCVVFGVYTLGKGSPHRGRELMSRGRMWNYLCFCHLYV